MYANQHCVISGINGVGDCTNRFVNFVTGVGGEYTVNVQMTGVHIGGDTDQVFLCTSKHPSGMAYYALDAGDNSVACRNGEFSLFFVDQAERSDNSGHATVKLYR